MKKIWRFIKDEDGLETVEYAVIAGLILVGTILTIQLIGGDVATIFTNLQADTSVAAGTGT